MNIYSLLRESRKLRGEPRPIVTTGVIASFDAGRWRVVSGQTTYLAATGIAQELQAGDRVYLLQNQGITKIIGLLGADVNVP